MILNAIDMTRVLSLFAYNSDEPMLFTSGLFWVLFLVFLPVYALLKCGWYFLLLVATSLIDWWLARWIDSRQDRTGRRVALTASLVMSLGVLLLFKYSNFVMANLESLIGGNFQPMDLILPVGISFYTFRTISYVVDVYKRRLQPVEDYVDYLFFLSYFPWERSSLSMTTSTTCSSSRSSPAW